MVKSQSAVFTLKGKISRFAVNVGTYIVTCGTAKSRKLQKMREKYDETSLNEENEEAEETNVKSKRRLNMKKFASKNKSFMLLSSSQTSVFDD